jgi:hypothetical protein
MKIAHVIKGLIFEIFEAESMPEWGPYPNGKLPVLVDITGQEARQDDGWNSQTNTVAPRPAPQDDRIVTWDEESCEFRVETDEEKELRLSA